MSNDIKYAAKFLAKVARMLGWQVQISSPTPDRVDGFFVGTNEFLDRWAPKNVDRFEPKTQPVRDA